MLVWVAGIRKFTLPCTFSSLNFITEEKLPFLKCRFIGDSFRRELDKFLCSFAFLQHDDSSSWSYFRWTIFPFFGRSKVGPHLPLFLRC